MVLKKDISKIFLLFLLIALIIFLPACTEKDGSGYLFRYSLLGDPKIIDPQIAEDVSSLVIIANTFDGLLKITDDGKLAENAASDYSVSADGLVYTFTLKENNYWTDGTADYKEAVTANDFVFAFQRIFDKNTHSPYAEEFSCIKNGKSIIDGTLDKSALGIAADGDFSLIIELDYPNANFLSLLTNSAAMPCNEEFFNAAQGKYGLEADKTLSNGPFFVKQWQYDPYGKNNFLILRRNKNYGDIETVFPNSLNFFIEKEAESMNKSFFSSSTDCIVSNGSDKQIFQSSYLQKEYETTSCGLLFNLQSEAFGIKQLRDGLALSIDRSTYGNELGQGLRAAYGIVPAGITMLNKSYRELVSESDKSVYDISAAKKQWNDGLVLASKMNIDAVKILIPESFPNPLILKTLTQEWQNKLQFFCGIEIVSDKEYATRLGEGKYDIALYSLQCGYNSPKAILDNFSAGNSFGYSNTEVDALLEKSGRAEALSECVKLYAAAEKLIISDTVYTPLFYRKEYLVYGKDMTDIVYNPFTKQIFFENAKNFG